jgi:type I restriction enzyme S subunit
MSQGKKIDGNPLGFSISSDEMEDTLIGKRYLPKFMQVMRDIKKSQLKKMQVKDIAQILRTGANVDNLDYVDNPNEGIAYILVKNVLSEGLTCSNLKYIRKSIVNEIKSSLVTEGDIVINRCGDAGLSAIIPKDLGTAAACGFSFILRCKRQFNPYYVAAFLNSEYGKNQLKRIALGSVLEHITKEELRQVWILYPDKIVETKIANDFKSAEELRTKARKSIEEVEASFNNIVI